MLYTKEIPLKDKFDVLVAGGGVAGFCAAVAAARQGKKVALLENNGALGGILTVGGNPQIGIFFAYYRQAIAGIGWELCKNLEAQGFATIPDFSKIDTRLGGIPSNVKVCAPMAEAEMNRMCLEAGVRLFFHTKIVDAVVQNDKVCGVIAAEKNGLALFAADVFIDCTGDGDLSILSGASYQKSEVLQPGTYGYTFRTNNLEALSDGELREKFQQKRENGEILHGDFWPEYHAPIKNFFIEGGDNANHVVMDGSMAEGLTKAEIEGREKMARMLRFAKEEADVTVFSSAAYTAPRETRRIVCDKEISKADFLSGKIEEDSVCYGYYNIDLHTYEENNALKGQRLPDGVVPTIPYRALQVKGLTNLLVAGRCACADREVMSALRVKASCMAMGEAAGTAAALAVKQSGEVRAVNLALLKKTLSDSGAIVPSESLFSPAGKD
ncbi:MAG: FAD-dependent oxidoreductase [Clostridia bacterium]|nr:FAD-dependent oxidoreductase [Clostridia bacterium]